MSYPSETQREATFKAVMAAYDAGISHASADVEQCEMRAYQAGELAGYLKATNELKPAVSDGFRQGSSVCAKVMNMWRNTGIMSEGEAMFEQIIQDDLTKD